MRLIDRVSEICAQKGIRKQDMPYMCGVARETLYRGVRKRATLAALAYGLGVTVEELVTGTDAEELWEFG